MHRSINVITTELSRKCHLWDAMDRSALVELTGMADLSTDFGFLLRHYWFPATRLEYRFSTVQHSTSDHDIAMTHILARDMVRCDADQCAWRERGVASHGDDPGLVRYAPAGDHEEIRIYDRSKQTFRRRPILGFDPFPNNETEARTLAFLEQPVLTPLLPIPLGFTWHVHNENGYMEFTLDSAEMIGKMPILIIRRRGEFRLDCFYRDRTKWPMAGLLLREGITAYALERGIVLEDRTRDVLRCAESNPPLDGMETLTTLSLNRSCHILNVPSLAPLLTRFETKTGQRYLYDSGTGSILSVDEAVDTMIDDYRVLTPEEIKIKFEPVLGKERVSESYRSLEETRKGGTLVDHAPASLSRIDKIAYDGQVYDVGEFWHQNAMLLILGLTERCNLDCAYCCYSGKFAGQRVHSTRRMTWEIAEKAIRDYLDHDQVGDGTAPITFYGGEPLLEFNHLFQECVHFAVTHARGLGKKVRFAITTNGTLLDDEVVDFLVRHEFLVMVSLDGPQEAHDRYRVFPNGQGSFRIVEENLKRFVKRYPDYRQRGINFTLAPPLDLESVGKVVAEFFPDYPLSRTSLVNTGMDHRFPDDVIGTTQYGCHATTACRKSGVDQESFRRFGDKESQSIRRLWNECMESITQHGMIKTSELMPLAYLLFGTQIGFYHRRNVTSRTPETSFYVPCLPGFSRRYVDVEGNYRVCERVDNSSAYVLGNVRDGLDVAAMKRTMEFRRHCGDCANCHALKTCDACYAKIPGDEAVGGGFDPMFDVQCQRTRQATKELFKTYSEIMENNPEAFDQLTVEDLPQFKPIKFGTTGSIPTKSQLAMIATETK